MQPSASVTQWIEQLRAGQTAAAERIWNRYFPRLAKLAQVRLQTRADAGVDGEDVALSALDTLFRGLKEGRYERLGDRDELWRLLVTIAFHKAADVAAAAARQKRNAAQCAGASPAPLQLDDWNVVAGPTPTAESLALFAEQLSLLLGGLPNDTCRRVAVLRLEGYTNDEIAERLQCARRTVARKLDVVRSIWREAMK